MEDIIWIILHLGEKQQLKTLLWDQIASLTEACNIVISIWPVTESEMSCWYFRHWLQRKLSKWQLLLQIMTKLFVNMSFLFQGVETITNVGETWENSILADNRKYFVCTKPYWATKHGGWKQIDTQLNTTLLIALGRPDVNTNVQIYWSTMLIQVNVGY